MQTNHDGNEHLTKFLEEAADKMSPPFFLERLSQYNFWKLSYCFHKNFSQDSFQVKSFLMKTSVQMFASAILSIYNC